jgi:D-lyxose ketol-isomerase
MRHTRILPGWHAFDMNKEEEVWLDAKLMLSIEYARITYKYVGLMLFIFCNKREREREKKQQLENSKIYTTNNKRTSFYCIKIKC